MDGHTQKSCSQHLNVQMEIYNKRCSSLVVSGVVSGLVLLNDFINDIDSMIEGILSKFAEDTKLSGAAGLLEGNDLEGPCAGLRTGPV